VADLEHGRPTSRFGPKRKKLPKSLTTPASKRLSGKAPSGSAQVHFSAPVAFAFLLRFFAAAAPIFLPPITTNPFFFATRRSINPAANQSRQG